MTRVYTILAAIGAAIMVVVGAFLRGSKSGKDSAKAKAQKKVLKNVQKADKARRDQRDSGNRDRVSKFDR